ncbi:hypothetical protein BDL97_17G049800 [Sphagnum fallax]|nr:hypothetical protein BDL97_17G049800 [Sphagnum fallax]
MMHEPGCLRFSLYFVGFGIPQCECPSFHLRTHTPHINIRFLLVCSCCCCCCCCCCCLKISWLQSGCFGRTSLLVCCISVYKDKMTMISSLTQCIQKKRTTSSLIYYVWLGKANIEF